MADDCGYSPFDPDGVCPEPPAHDIKINCSRDHERQLRVCSYHLGYLDGGAENAVCRVCHVEHSQFVPVWIQRVPK